MTAETQQTTAVLLIAHGSRRPEANADLAVMVERVRERGGYDIVQPSYLELAEPSIPAGARRCVEAGGARVLMLPFFLSAGNHVKEDLERFRGELSASFPEVMFVLCPPLGLHPLMTDIIFARLQEGDGSAA